MLWRNADKQIVYTISKPEELARYRTDTTQDQHSLVAEITFVDADSGDFRLAEGNVAIDRGVPLTRTTTIGRGTEVPVEDVSCFSAGFKSSTGEILIPGDDITIAGLWAKVLAIDRETSTLTIDRRLDWAKGAPVNYPYEGSAPDVGAMEMR